MQGLVRRTLRFLSYLTISASTAVRFDAEFTIQCWYRPTAYAGFCTLVNLGNVNSVNGAILFRSNYVAIRYGAAFADFFYTSDQTVTYPTLNAWYLMTLLRDANNIVRVYVNTTLVYSTPIAITGPLGNTSGQGKNGRGWRKPLNGVQRQPSILCLTPMLPQRTGNNRTM